MNDRPNERSNKRLNNRSNESPTKRSLLLANAASVDGTALSIVATQGRLAPAQTNHRSACLIECLRFENRRNDQKATISMHRRQPPMAGFKRA